MLHENIKKFDFARPDPTFFREQPVTHQEILAWARTCPDGTILDMAAGFGIEALALRNNGFEVIAQEPDPYYRYWSKTPLVEGRAESLFQYSPHSLSGAYLKDSLIFLSKQQRVDMFRGLRHSLKPNGRVLIISQYSDYFIASGQFGAWEVKTGRYSDFQSILAYKLEQQPQQEIYIEYAANLPETISLATDAGFSIVSSREFSKKDQISIENPWHSSPGFIISLELK